MWTQNLLAQIGKSYYLNYMDTLEILKMQVIYVPGPFPAFIVNNLKTVGVSCTYLRADFGPWASCCFFFKLRDQSACSWIIYTSLVKFRSKQIQLCENRKHLNLTNSYFSSRNSLPSLETSSIVHTFNIHPLSMPMLQPPSFLRKAVSLDTVSTSANQLKRGLPSQGCVISRAMPTPETVRSGQWIEARCPMTFLLSLRNCLTRFAQVFIVLVEKCPSKFF